MIDQRSEGRLCAAGTLALAAGVAVYLCARGAHPSLPALAACTGWLPTLLHTAAFVSFSLAVTAPWPRLATVVCATWLILEGGFEMLQIDSIAEVLQTSAPVHASPLLRAFLGGTFDPFDLLGAVAGALLAYAFAAHLNRHRAARGAR